MYREVRRSGERGDHRGRDSLVCGEIRRRFGEKWQRGAWREKGRGNEIDVEGYWNEEEAIWKGDSTRKPHF